MIAAQDVEDFVRADYATKDVMHDLSHVQRILRSARRLAVAHPCDDELLVFGAYFHGVIYAKENEVYAFLRSREVPTARIERIVHVAWESQKDSEPVTLEGTILQDAHLTEGGRTFLIAKSLVTGTARGQTLAETIAYVKQNILGKFRCTLPEAQAAYVIAEQFARDFIAELEADL